jgi:hypothetical protein
MSKTTPKNNDTTANLGFEAKLWAAADALRNNMDAAEYSDWRGELLKDDKRWVYGTPPAGHRPQHTERRIGSSCS